MMKLFVKANCPWCVDATAYLRSQDIPFDEVDVHQDPVAFHEMETLSGQTKAPTLVLKNGAVLPDFDVQELKIFFRDQGILIK